MQFTRLDDYQSWLLTHGSTHVLIDPWLTSTVLTGGFNRNHSTGFTPIDAIPTPTAVVLCTDIADHCRPETLALLPLSTPTHGPAKAVKVARRAGLESTHAHGVGESFVVGEGTSALEFRVVRTGFPLNFVAVAYVISPLSGNGPTVFFDPHLPSARSAKQVKSADVFVAPVKGVVAGPLPATAGPGRVARAARALGARTIIPTALEPRRDWNWWQKIVFGVWGSADVLQRRVGSASRVVPTTDTVVNVS